MIPPFDNDAFWRGGDVHVAANPHRCSEADGLAEFAKAHEPAGGLIFFSTSGTEDIPKWCGLSRKAMLASARAVNAHLESTSRDRWLIALPLHHVGGFSIFARCFVSGASYLRMAGKWGAAQFAEMCVKEAVTLASLVPAQVFDLVQAKIHAPLSLRAVVVGGAGMIKELGQRAQELGWRVLQSYGMTETASQVATEPLDHLYQGFDPDRLEVLQGWDLATDEADTLIVRGDGLASGYAVNQGGAWTWEPIDPARGLRTRDRVQLWTHGTRRFLRFLGRETSFVKINGELVNVSAVQARIDALRAEHGIGARMIVLNVPDARSGVRLALAAEGDAGTLDQIVALHHTACAPQERFALSSVIGVIPATDLGKTNLPALRALLAQRLSSE